MKTKLLLLSLAFIALTALGQNSVPNGNFETWNSVSYDYPQNYPYNSNYDILYRYQSSLPFNVVKTDVAYHGSSAIQLSTVVLGTDTAMAYFINANPNNGDPSTWSGGMPYDQKPTGITGFYKYNVAAGDEAIIFAVFSKGGVNIGTYVSSIGGLHSDYVPFNITFNPALTQTPDAVIFAATSSNIMVKENGVAGSVLILDNVSFTGVTSQPALMNGDFETWDSQTIYSPATWFTQGESDGVNRTTDAQKGVYAIELKTYLGSNNANKPVARAGQIATGYYPKNCSGNCTEIGGHKFTNQVDTLAFWYKYAPATDDSAQVYLQFKKNGLPMNGVHKMLPASVEYQYFELPFNLWQAPDTVIVNLQSAGWYDTLVSSVGSTLIVDEVHFKSQPILYTGRTKFAPETNMTIFPNPSTGKFRIRNNAEVVGVIVYNQLGKEVYSRMSTGNEKLNEIDLTRLKKGVYFIEIYDPVHRYTQKIVIQ